MALVALTLLAGAAVPLPVVGEPATPDFVWTPAVPRAHDDVRFVSADDPGDQVILLRKWVTPDGRESMDIEDEGSEWTFTRRGDYEVRHAVLDTTGQERWVSKTVTVASTPPVVSLHIRPLPAFRGPTTFLALVHDVDGDPFTATWTFDDGATATGVETTRTYSELGPRTVRLDIENGVDPAVTITKTFEIVNLPPACWIQVSDSTPAVGQSVHFTAMANDPDASPGPFSYQWQVGNDEGRVSIVTTREFDWTWNARGTFIVHLMVTDGEGAASPVSSRAISVA